MNTGKNETIWRDAYYSLCRAVCRDPIAVGAAIGYMYGDTYRDIAERLARWRGISPPAIGRHVLRGMAVLAQENVKQNYTPEDDV